MFLMLQSELTPVMFLNISLLYRYNSVASFVIISYESSVYILAEDRGVVVDIKNR